MSKHVLWVEDEKDQFNAYAWALQKSNYNITLAHDYAEAVDLLSKNKYDAYIVDILIPNGLTLTEADLITIDKRYYGIELINLIRSSKDKTPIIVVTVVKDKLKSEAIKTIDKNISILYKYDIDAEIIKKNVDDILCK